MRDWGWHHRCAPGDSRESLDTRPRQREVEGRARQLVRVRVTILGAEHPRVLRVGEAHEVPEPRVAGDDHVRPPVRPRPGRVTPVLGPGQVHRGAAPGLQRHRGRAAARGQVQRGRGGGQRTLGPGDRAQGLGLGWDRVAAWERTRDRGRARLGDRDQQHGLDHSPGEVEVAARLARYPGLLPKLDPHDVVCLAAEHGAHEARVAAALDVGDHLELALLPILDDVMTRDVTVLGVEHVLEVPQLEAPLPAVDVEVDVCVKRGPGVVRGHPARQLAPGSWTVNWKENSHCIGEDVMDNGKTVNISFTLSRLVLISNMFSAHLSPSRRSCIPPEVTTARCRRRSGTGPSAPSCCPPCRTSRTRSTCTCSRRCTRAPGSSRPPGSSCSPLTRLPGTGAPPWRSRSRPRQCRPGSWAAAGGCRSRSPDRTWGCRTYWGRSRPWCSWRGRGPWRGIWSARRLVWTSCASERRQRCQNKESRKCQNMSHNNLKRRKSVSK